MSVEKLLSKPPLREEAVPTRYTLLAFNDKGQQFTQVGVRDTSEHGSSVKHAVDNVFRHYPDGRVSRIVVVDDAGPLKEVRFDDWQQGLREGRDDIKKLPITPQAKAYARRKGLKSMLNQPKDYQNMVSAELHQNFKGFPNSDVAQSTSGGKPKKNAIKEGRYSESVERFLR